MTISKKQFQIRRAPARAISKLNPKLDIGVKSSTPFTPRYSSVESLYKKEKQTLGLQYTRGLPDPKCIDRFENAKHLAEVILKRLQTRRCLVFLTLSLPYNTFRILKYSHCHNKRL